MLFKFIKSLITNEFLMNAAGEQRELTEEEIAKYYEKSFKRPKGEELTESEIGLGYLESVRRQQDERRRAMERELRLNEEREKYGGMTEQEFTEAYERSIRQPQKLRMKDEGPPVPPKPSFVKQPIASTTTQKPSITTQKLSTTGQKPSITTQQPSTTTQQPSITGQRGKDLTEEEISNLYELNILGEQKKRREEEQSKATDLASLFAKGAEKMAKYQQYSDPEPEEEEVKEKWK